jgi:hypothetical protein
MAHLFLVLLARQRLYQQEYLAVQMHSYLDTGVFMLLFLCGGKTFFSAN